MLFRITYSVFIIISAVNIGVFPIDNIDDLPIIAILTCDIGLLDVISNSTKILLIVLSYL